MDCAAAGADKSMLTAREPRPDADDNLTDYAAGAAAPRHKGY
jgi:hypothetical protein